MFAEMVLLSARYADELRPRLPRLRYSNVPPPPRSRPGMPVLTKINGSFLCSVPVCVPL